MQRKDFVAVFLWVCTLILLANSYSLLTLADGGNFTYKNESSIVELIRCTVRALASFCKRGIQGTWTDAARIFSRRAAIVSADARSRSVILNTGRYPTVEF